MVLLTRNSVHFSPDPEPPLEQLKAELEFAEKRAEGHMQDFPDTRYHILAILAKRRGRIEAIEANQWNWKFTSTSAQKP